jgi:membrane glycosyltransferase
MDKNKLILKLRLIMISPVVIGVIVCSVISIATIFEQNLNWLQDSEIVIIEEEMQHLNKISESFCECFESIVDTVYFN